MDGDDEIVLSSGEEDNEMETEEVEIKPDMQVQWEARLRECFGLETFNEWQWDVLNNMKTEHHDVIAVLPPAAGKSLLYQFSGVMGKQLLVVCPLQAQIHCQLRQIEKVRGLKAVHVDVKKQLTSLEQQALVYVTPACFYSRYHHLMSAMPALAHVVIEEFQCALSGGHAYSADFYKIYSRLGSLRQRMANERREVRWMALSSAADDTAVENIGNMLHLRFPLITKRPSDRSNVRLRAERKLPDSLKQLHNYVVQYGRGIVYCRSKKDVDKVHKHLTAHGTRAGRYHGGVPEEDRRQAHRRFARCSRQCQVMVATSSFGGVHLPAVKYTIHFGAPHSLVSYWQEAGRCGREGQSGLSMILWGRRDTADSHASVEQYLQSKGCRRLMLSAYLDDGRPLLIDSDAHVTNGRCCDNCCALHDNVKQKRRAVAKLDECGRSSPADEPSIPATAASNQDSPQPGPSGVQQHFRESPPVPITSGTGAAPSTESADDSNRKRQATPSCPSQPEPPKRPRQQLPTPDAAEQRPHDLQLQHLRVQELAPVRRDPPRQRRSNASRPGDRLKKLITKTHKNCPVFASYSYSHKKCPR